MWFVKTKRAQSSTDDEKWQEGGVCPTLNSFDSGDTRAVVAIMEKDMKTVRRLTPLECERLQGFPDGWTEIGIDDKPQADSHRYKQMGNAVAVPVVEWIMQRLVEVENDTI